MNTMYDKAIEAFLRLDVSNYVDADKFFEEYGPGNTLSFITYPYERFSLYVALLNTLEHADPAKYKLVHKGVPFYFMAWLLFDMQNYEKALFYMDTAMSEDINRDPEGWQNGPASGFLKLTTKDQVARRVVDQILNLLKTEIERFCRISGNELTTDDFVRKFVGRLVVSNSPSQRSVITAFYSFLLEFEDRFHDLELRGNSRGSMEPFLVHLFKGGLIFESLLKNHYPIPGTLGDILSNASFKKDFGLKQVATSARALEPILIKASGTDMETAFEVTAQLRNTTGHNLVWNDIFNEPNNYRILFQQQINAILYITVTIF